MFRRSDNKENLSGHNCEQLERHASHDLDEVNRGSHWKRDSKQSTPLRSRFKELVRQGDYEAMLAALQEIRSERKARHELKELSHQGNYRQVQNSLNELRHEKKASSMSYQEATLKKMAGAEVSQSGYSKNNENTGHRRPLERITGKSQSSFGKLFGRKIANSSNQVVRQEPKNGKVASKRKRASGKDCSASASSTIVGQSSLGVFFGRREALKGAQAIEHDQEETVTTEDDNYLKNVEYISACSPFEWDNGSNVSLEAYYEGSHTFARTGNTELEAMLFQSK